MAIQNLNLHWANAHASQAPSTYFIFETNYTNQTEEWNVNVLR